MKTSDYKKPGKTVASYNGFNVIHTPKGKLVKQMGKWVKK